MRRTEGYDKQVQLLSPEATTTIPPGADDVLLGSGSIGAARTQVVATLARWGHVLPPDAVHPTTEGNALRWDGAWGKRPATAPVPANLSPIDAQCALGWLRSLGAWAAIAAPDRERIAAILGGELNERSIAARNLIASKRVELAQLADGEGLCQALSQATDADKAYPFLMAKEIRPAPAGQGGFSITQVSTLDDYVFQQDVMQETKRKATRYEVTYQQAGQPDRGFEVVDHDPADPVVKMFKEGGKQPQWLSVKRLAELGLLIPDADRDAVARVELPPNGGKNASGLAYPAPINLIVILPQSDKYRKALGADADQALDETVLHEMGHRAAMSKGGWGGSDEARATAPGDGSGFGRWRDAIESDGTYVSAYAKNTVAGTEQGTVQSGDPKNVLIGDKKKEPTGSNVHEDFAETYAAYFGFTDKVFAEYEKMVPNRFGLLRNEFEGAGPKRDKPKPEVDGG